MDGRFKMMGVYMNRVLGYALRTTPVALRVLKDLATEAMFFFVVSKTTSSFLMSVPASGRKLEEVWDIVAVHGKRDLIEQ